MTFEQGNAGMSRRTLLRRGGKLGLAIGLSGVAVNALAGCGSDDDGGGGNADPRLGWIEPKTGRLAAAYAPIYVGARMAVEEINAAGGILGRPLTLLEEDDEGSPSTQTSVARRLASRDPSFVLGPTGSSQAVASVSALSREQVVQSAWGGADSLADGKKFPFHYQLIYRTGQQARIAARYLVENRGLKRIGLLVENSEFGTDIRDAMVAELRDTYKMKPASIQVFEVDAPDMAPFVRKLASAKVDGLALFTGQPQATILSLRTMADIDWVPQIVSHDLNYIVAYDEVPDKVLENYSGTTYAALTYPRGGKPSGPAVEHAKQLLKNPEARVATYSAATSPYYDYLKLIADVAADIKSVDPDKLKKALDGTRNWKGMRSPLSFTADQHNGIPDEQIAVGSMISARDKRSISGIFRERVDQ